MFLNSKTLSVDFYNKKPIILNPVSSFSGVAPDIIYLKREVALNKQKMSQMPKAKEILFAVILLLYSFAYLLPFLVSNLTRFDWESETIKLIQENNIERVFLVTSTETALAALIFIIGIIPIVQVLKQIILNIKGSSSLSDF